MKALFGADGEVAGWLLDDVIFDKFGRPRAFLRGDNVFNYEGRHLGQVEHFYLWDHAGKAVAFLIGANNGPTVPECDEDQKPPYPALEPKRPNHLIPPEKPHPETREWSEMTLAEFLI